LEIRVLRKLPPLLLLCLPFILVGCGEASENVANQLLDEHKKLLAIIDGVTDEASAKAVAPQVEAVGKRVVELLEKGEKLKDPPKEFQVKFEKEMGQVTADLQTKILALKKSNPKAAQILAEALSGTVKAIQAR
jgi:hypothetical protein